MSEFVSRLHCDHFFIEGMPADFAVGLRSIQATASFIDDSKVDDQISVRAVIYPLQSSSDEKFLPEGLLFTYSAKCGANIEGFFEAADWALRKTISRQVRESLGRRGMFEANRRTREAGFVAGMLLGG